MHRTAAQTVAACKRLTHRVLATLICGILFSTFSFADDAVPADPSPQWWKGNLHTHSLWSDGNDFPEMISEWYRTHDYNFLAMTDHNTLAKGARWMKASEINKRSTRAIKKYHARFGDGWIETRVAKLAGAATDGAPDDSQTETEYRLKPFNEYRSLVEERGKFILLQGEEISDSVGGLPLHINASNIDKAIMPLGGETIATAMEANLRAVESQAEQLGREMLVHVNHPNFGYAVTAADLAKVVSERFFEVYNGHPAVNQDGDDEHISIEKMWDVANAIRLQQYNAPPLMGIATDDSHHYHGGEASPGRGWVVVHANYLTPESLIRAMKRGDFYASTGVQLSKVDFDDSKRTLRIEIVAEPGVTYETRFIGTKIADTESKEPDPALAGVTFATRNGAVVEYEMADKELYVRAKIVSNRQHPNPPVGEQFESAWSQPVGWTATEAKR